MSESTILARGEDGYITISAVLTKAALRKGLKLEPWASVGLSNPHSVAIRGFENHAITLKEYKELADETGEITGWHRINPEGSIAELIKNGRGPIVTLRIEFAMNFALTGGVILAPIAYGLSSSSTDKAVIKSLNNVHIQPWDNAAKHQMFRVLVDSNGEAPAVAKELAASGSSIIVTWAELGLGGARRIADIFSEFSGTNEAVAALGKSGSVFNPTPYPPNQRFGEQLIILMPWQANLFATWRSQLNEYREKLKL